MMPRPFGPKPLPQPPIARAREGPSGESVAGLLVALGLAGIELGTHPADPGRLRYRPTTLPPDLLEGLHAHRAAILGLLSSIDGKGGYAPAREDAAIVCGERLGMADGLGMPTHPGSPAWLVAMGEGWNTLDELCDTGTLSDLILKNGRIERETLQVEVC